MEIMVNYIQKKVDFSETGISFITAAQVNNFNIDHNGAYKLEGEPLEKTEDRICKKR